MVEIEYDTTFDNPNDERPYMIYPKIFGDNRGSFSEVLAGEDAIWIKQINRSISIGGTIRGCHAQRGKSCQGKLVEAINAKIYDIIIDARPDSKTFGTSKIYILDSNIQNKLWIPRGFLHSFVVSKQFSNAIFQYFCDNLYDNKSELCINPLTILPNIINLYKSNNILKNIQDLYNVFDDKNINISSKDINGLNYSEWMNFTLNEYKNNKLCWYK